MCARMNRATALGPLAQLDLERADDQQAIEAVLPAAYFAGLQLNEGDTLVVRPTRARIFDRSPT